MSKIQIILLTHQELPPKAIVEKDSIPPKEKVQLVQIGIMPPKPTVQTGIMPPIQKYSVLQKAIVRTKCYVR
jgi:hypothetical protein